MPKPEAELHPVDLYLQTAEQKAAEFYHLHAEYGLKVEDFRKQHKIGTAETLAEHLSKLLLYTESLQVQAFADFFGRVSAILGPDAALPPFTPFLDSDEEYQVRVNSTTYHSISELLRTNPTIFIRFNSVLVQGATDSPPPQVPNATTITASDLRADVLKNQTLLLQSPVLLSVGQQTYFAVPVPPKLRIPSQKAVKKRSYSQLDKMMSREGNVYLLCSDIESHAQLLRILCTEPQLLGCFLEEELKRLQSSLLDQASRMVQSVLFAKQLFGSQQSAAFNTAVLTHLMSLLVKTVQSGERILISIIQTEALEFSPDLGVEILAHFRLLTQWLITAVHEDKTAIRVIQIPEESVGRTDPEPNISATTAVDMRVASNTERFSLQTRQPFLSEDWNYMIPATINLFMYFFTLCAHTTPKDILTSDSLAIITAQRALHRILRTTTLSDFLYQLRGSNDLYNERYRAVVTTSGKPPNFMFDEWQWIVRGE